MPGFSVHGSIEYWSAWQRLNEAKENRRESVAMMHSFSRIANHALDNGGFVSYEWPRYCSGWMSEPLASWITERQLLSPTVTAKEGGPARKPWRFVTNNARLAESCGKVETRS